MTLSRSARLFFVLAAFALFIVACGPQDATEEAVEEEATEMVEEATEEAMEEDMDEEADADADAEAASVIDRTEPIESLCLVTDLGRVNDGTFNQYAHEGATSVSEDFELEYNFIETVSEADYEANIQSCIDDGADSVVTVGFLIQDATVAAAIANPDVFFVGVDQFLADGPANMIGLQFREDQAGFLVGVLAALVANEAGEETIGGVYGIDVPAVKRFRNGYEQGALYVNPEWEVGTNILGAYADSFLDQAQGISLANQFIGEGATILFGAGGPLGSAAIAEAASQGLYVIGVDQDEYLTTFASGETEGAEFLISSATKRVDQGVYDAISFLADADFDTWNEFGGGNYLLDAELEGVGFAPFNDSEATLTENLGEGVPASLTTEVEAALGLLIDGCISTNVDPVSGDLMSEEAMAEFMPADGCDMMDDMGDEAMDDESEEDMGEEEESSDEDMDDESEEEDMGEEESEEEGDE
ncbi:MAG: BMP family ABC transporter substrate-binding protein [Chloroflexota bacterium]